MDEDHRLRCATNISQVCRRWREVALKTPFLWHKIHISFKYHPVQVDFFWKRMTSRIQAFPPEIVFDAVNWSDKGMQILRICKLSQFSRIKNLQFHFHPRHEHIFSHNGIEIPTGQVERLTLLGLEEAGDENYVTSIDEILSKFTTASMVAVCGLSLSPFKPGRVLHHVIDLSISIASSVSLTQFPAAFPNLKRAGFLGVKFTRHNDRTITWPSIQSLQMQLSSGTPWLHLKTPAIQNLRAVGVDKNHLEEFLSSHPLLQTINVDVSDLPLSSILKAAPNVISAAINLSTCGIGNPEPLEMKNLQEIALFYNNPGDDLSIGSLKNIINSYILPNTAKIQSYQDRKFTLRVWVREKAHMGSAAQLESYKSYLLLSGAVNVEETKESHRNVVESLEFSEYMVYSYTWK